MAWGDINDNDRQTLGRFARHVLVVVIIVVFGLLVWRIINALLLTFIGVLFAVLWRGLATPISRHTPVPIEWALLIVALLLALLVGLFVWFAGPPINDQLSQLAKTLPSSIKQIEEALNRSVVGRYLLDYIQEAQLPTGKGGSVISGITGIASTLYEIVADILLVIVSAIYFSINPDVYRRGILLLIPRNRVARVAEVLDRTVLTLQYWLLGQVALMVSVGALVALGLWLVGIPLAFVLGLISGLLEFIPIIGPVAGAIPGVLIALTGGWTMAAYAILVYVLVQQVENHVLVPLVQRAAVSVPPALVVVAVVAFGFLFGFLGVLAATPLTAVALVWVEMLYVQDVLGRSLR